MNTSDLRQKIALAWAGENIPPRHLLEGSDDDGLDFVRAFSGRHWDDIDFKRRWISGGLIGLAPAGLKYYVRCYLDIALNVNDGNCGEPEWELMFWLIQRSERSKTAAQWSPAQAECIADFVAWAHSNPDLAGCVDAKALERSVKWWRDYSKRMTGRS